MWPNSWFPLVWLPFPIQASCWRYLGLLVPELFFLVSSVLKHHIPLFFLVSPVLVPVPPLFLLRSSVLAPPTPPHSRPLGCSLVNFQTCQQLQMGPQRTKCCR